MAASPLAATISSASSSGATSDVSGLIAKALPGVVSIDVSSARQQAAGTGMIVTSDGTIVTNAHVVTGGPSATEGIVSALNRAITTDNNEQLGHVIQTDAAINPGNSGGPLLALDGTVVGINSAGASGAQNVGFAISVDQAKPIIAQLEQGQTVETPYLGVSSGPVDATIVSQKGLSVDHGQYIARSARTHRHRPRVCKPGT